jgi:hypothetical protein
MSNINRFNKPPVNTTKTPNNKDEEMNTNISNQVNSSGNPQSAASNSAIASKGGSVNFQVIAAPKEPDKIQVQNFCNLVDKLPELVANNATSEARMAACAALVASHSGLENPNKVATTLFNICDKYANTH